MADLLISKVPDTSIRAKVASQGGYDPCDEGSTPSRWIKYYLLILVLNAFLIMYYIFFLMLGIKEVQTLENPFKPIAQLEQ